MRLSYSPDTSTSRVAVVGRAVRGNVGVVQTVTRALEHLNVSTRWVDASRSSLSCLVPRTSVEDVVCALHDALDLGALTSRPDGREDA